MKAKKYDVIVSILVHDAPEILPGIINNFSKFIPWNWACIFNIANNLSDDIHFNKIKNSIKCDNVYFYESDHDRVKYTFDIGRGHLESIIFLNAKNIKFDNILFFSSNSLFIKKLPELSSLDRDSKLRHSKNNDIFRERTNSWPTLECFNSSSEFPKFCLDNSIGIKKQLLEGCIYESSVVFFLLNFYIERPEIFPVGKFVNINAYPAEEYIFPTLYFWLMGRMPIQLVYFDWDPDLTVVVRLRNSKNLNSYGLKRVDRTLDSPIRKQIELLH